MGLPVASAGSPHDGPGDDPQRQDGVPDHYGDEGEVSTARGGPGRIAGTRDPVGRNDRDEVPKNNQRNLRAPVRRKQERCERIESSDACDDVGQPRGAPDDVGVVVRHVVGRSDREDRRRERPCGTDTNVRRAPERVAQTDRSEEDGEKGRKAEEVERDAASR